MGNVDFGILNTAPVAHPMQVIQTPNASMESSQSALQGLNAGTDAAAKIQQMNINRQLLPGQLQNQQLLNQGQGILNQTNQIALEKAKQDQQFRNQDLAAFTAGKNKGGTTAGLDAMQDSMMSHDPAGAVLLQQTRQDIAQKADKGNVEAITNAGSMLHGIMVQSQATKESPLELYKQQYAQIKRADHDAPDPKSFKNDAQFQASYVMPTLSMALPYQKQIAAQQEMDKSNNLLQAQNLVARRKQQLIKTMHDPNSSAEAKQDAADNLQQAQDEATAVTYGHSPFGQLEHNVSEAISGVASSVTKKIGELGKSTPVKPSTAPAPMPTFDSKKEFQDWYATQPPEVQQAVQTQLGKQ